MFIIQIYLFEKKHQQRGYRLIPQSKKLILQIINPYKLELSHPYKYGEQWGRHT